MGKDDTRQRILDAATALLSERWYSVVSVADICRTAGLSNGIFYTYYRNKEALIRALIEQYLLVLERSVAGLSVAGLSSDGPAAAAPGNGSPTEMLSAFVRAVFAVAHDHRELLSIFREGQYRFYEYEQRVRALYTAQLERILGGPVTEAQTLYVLSGIRFAAFRSVFNGVPVRIDDLVALILDGVFATPVTSEPDRIFDIQARPLAMKVLETSRERLLRAGRALFGERGFHDVNIHEIAAEAGLSVGSFYSYFTGKEEFYARIIELVSRDVRRFIQQNLDDALSRIEQEIQGVYLFAFLLTIDRSVYNLVREAEFVLPETVREYYDSFQRGYERNLRETRDHDRPTVINALLGISHYFGMELLFDHSMHHARELVEELGGYLHTGIRSLVDARQQERRNHGNGTDQGRRALRPGRTNRQYGARGADRH
jgi:AcrR family transcriptional regulator